jgi:hypothetical protein
MSETIEQSPDAPAIEPPAPGPFALYPELDSLPSVGAEALSAFASNVVRDYVRAVLVEPAIKRQFGIGMGIVKFTKPVAVAGVGVQMAVVEADAAVQQRALQHIISIGVPPKTEGGTGPVRGVIFLGAPEGTMAEVRARAEADRIAATGPPQLLREYVAPPGYEVMVVEDDLSGGKAPTSPDDPPPAPTTAAPVKTKAQELAAKRRQRRKRG